MAEKTKPQIWRSNAEHPGVPYGMWSAQLRDAANIVEQLLAALKAVEFEEGSGVCNYCGGYRKHTDDCGVKQAIASAEADGGNA